MIGLGLGLHRGGPRKPFHPADLGNLGFWRDKDQGVLHSVSPDIPAMPGQTVRRWQNLVNPGVYDADQTTGNFQPSYLSGCVFDAVNDLLDTVYPIVGRGWCIFIAGYLPTQSRAYPRLVSAFQLGGGDDFEATASFILYYNTASSRFEVMHAETAYVTAALPQNNAFRLILNCAGDGTLSLNRRVLYPHRAALPARALGQYLPLTSRPRALLRVLRRDHPGFYCMRTLLFLGLLSLLSLGMARPPHRPAETTVPAPQPGRQLTLQEQRWRDAKIRPEWAARVRQVTKRIRRDEWRYRAVAADTGVPWWAIAGIHNMESSGNFTKHLHEGSPLTGRTRYVPKGRPLPPAEPPFTWEESAKDALQYDRMHLVDWTDLTASLDALERYNGWGYRRYHPDVPTPYLWSGTTIYTAGKYVADGNWSQTAVSEQVGICAALPGLDRSVDN